MDLLGLIVVPTWLVYLSVLTLTVYIYHRMVNANSSSRKVDIPGPKPNFIFGHWPTIIKKGLLQTHIDWLKEYGNVIGLSGDDILLADPEILREVLTKQSHKFINRRSIETGSFFDLTLLNLKDEHWKHVRSIMTPTFSSGKLRQVAPLIYASGETFLQNLSKFHDEDKEFDASVICGNFTMDVIAATAFGIHVDSQTNPDDPFIKEAKKLQFSFKDPRLILILLFPKFAKHFSRLFKILGISSFSNLSFWSDLIEQLVEDRKLNEKEGKYKDFLQLTMNAAKEHEEKQTNGNGENSRRGMTNTELHANAVLFFLAGYDTTSQGLQYISYLLAVNPEWQDKVIAEVDEVLQGGKPDYDNVQKLTVMDMCICESMRLFPPGFMFDRKATEDVTINGYFIPKDSSITVPAYAMYRDPELYPDPEKFDPERFTAKAKQERNPYAYMPFGMGPRNCIGFRLAQMELKILVAMIYQKYKFLTCDKTQVPLVLDKNRPIRPSKGVWLKVATRE